MCGSDGKGQLCPYLRRIRSDWNCGLAGDWRDPASSEPLLTIRVVRWRYAVAISTPPPPTISTTSRRATSRSTSTADSTADAARGTTTQGRVAADSHLHSRPGCSPGPVAAAPPPGTAEQSSGSVCGVLRREGYRSPSGHAYPVLTPLFGRRACAGTVSTSPASSLGRSVPVPPQHVRLPDTPHWGCKPEVAGSIPARSTIESPANAGLSVVFEASAAAGVSTARTKAGSPACSPEISD